MGEPRVQSTYMKQFVARIELLGDASEPVLRADPELFAGVREASRMTWLPVEWNVRLVDALNHGLGRQRCHDFLTDQLTSQFTTPLWRGFIEGGIRTLGLDPAVLSRWIPAAMKLMFKDCGTWSVERLTETSAAVLARDLPPPLLQGRRWIDSVASGICALFILCRTSGEARVAAFDVDAGTARIELHWKAVTE